MSNKGNIFRFRRHDSIGAADAESDQDFLTECFIDTGDLQSLRDCSSPKRLVVGRTGVGKTALLGALRATEDHVIVLAPEVLALDYITNSTVLLFFESIGVQLDPFYSLLWRHVLTVELIRAKFGIRNEEKKREFFAWAAGIFQRDKRKQRALKYLEDWGSRFWEETEYRIKEYTTKLEQDLKACIAAQPIDGIDISAGGAQKLSEEQKHEVVQRAQHIVSGVQIKDLHEVMTILQEDVFDDLQQRYYVIIDRLDENWVDEKIRYKLLRALLESVRAFQQVPCVKIVVALRSDLLDRVFRRTRDAGFQEEKYESLILKLRWSKDELKALLDRRIDKLIKSQYTTQVVKLQDIVPKSQRRENPLDYILDRTFSRPREAILFLNEALTRAEGKSEISWQIIQSAEVQYSRKRLRSLADEWHSDFPMLPAYTRLLVKRRQSFLFGALTVADADAFMLALLDEDAVSGDTVLFSAEQYMDGHVSHEMFLALVCRILYQVGVLGFKSDPEAAVQWSHLDQPTMAVGQLSATTHLYVHPTFWSVLGTVR